MLFLQFFVAEVNFVLIQWILLFDSVEMVKEGVSDSSDLLIHLDVSVFIILFAL